MLLQNKWHRFLISSCFHCLSARNSGRFIPKTRSNSSSLRYCSRLVGSIPAGQAPPCLSSSAGTGSMSAASFGPGPKRARLTACAPKLKSVLPGGTAVGGGDAAATEGAEAGVLAGDAAGAEAGVFAGDAEGADAGVLAGDAAGAEAGAFAGDGPADAAGAPGLLAGESAAEVDEDWAICASSFSRRSSTSRRVGVFSSAGSSSWSSSGPPVGESSPRGARISRLRPLASRGFMELGPLSTASATGAGLLDFFFPILVVHTKVLPSGHDEHCHFT